MIQDIAPKHLDNTWKPRLPEPDDTVTMMAAIYF